jgi:hypothetical protein
MYHATTRDRRADCEAAMQCVDQTQGRHHVTTGVWLEDAIGHLLLRFHERNGNRQEHCRHHESRTTRDAPNLLQKVASVKTIAVG